MISTASLAAFLSVGASISLVHAQEGFVPLASQHFDYNDLPYQADPNDGERGRQYGYNICNSTTQNQESLCQTAIINSIDDFCLWGPPHPDGIIGNVEGEAVAWCTKSGHGTRIIPEGAITGVQFIRTPDYIQVTGMINQELINIEANDAGGEMDPHGADQRGNPLGGLMFSNAWGDGYQQVIEWHNFMGGRTFCLKACDPSGPNAASYCEHIFDRIGCYYNAPGKYEVGTFESCLGDNQDFPGIYTGEDGLTSTYTQPPEELGPITTTPYSVRIPASSSCVPFDPSSWTDAVAATATPQSPSTSTGASASTGTGTSTRTTNAFTSTDTSSPASTDIPDAALLGASPAVAGWVAGLAALVALVF